MALGPARKPAELERAQVPEVCKRVSNASDPLACSKAGGCLWHLGGCVKSGTSKHGKTSCNDGFVEVKCFDPSTCSDDVPGPSPDSRWALVYTHSMHTKFKGLKNETVVPLVQYARMLQNTDVVLVVPKAGVPLWNMRRRDEKRSPRDYAVGLTGEQKAELASQGVLVHEVDWLFPPEMKFAGRGAGCLGKDIFRLHVLGLEPYAAVAYFDTDTQLTGRGDFSQVMRCAASKNMFITTSGPLSPLNLGFMALRPDRRLFEAGVRLAQLANYDKSTGWGSAGHAPSKTPFVGAECGQGFVHTLLYKTASPSVVQAVEETGASLPTAVQVNRCIWNHQHDGPCKTGGCQAIVMLHKDLWSQCKKRNVSAGTSRQLAERFRCFEGVPGGGAADDEDSEGDSAAVVDAIVRGAA